MGVKQIDTNQDILHFYYNLLNVNENADIKTIKRAFHRLAKKYHPDISKNSREFLKILNAYNYIIKEKLAEENKASAKSANTQTAPPDLILPKNRVTFALSLADIARYRIFDRGKTNRRSGVHNPKGYDVAVYLSETELSYTPIVMIDIPARVVCPLCGGSDGFCPLCSGTGHIVKAVEVPVKIPATVDNDEIITIDLTKVKLKNYAYFLIKKLRVRIKYI